MKTISELYDAIASMPPRTVAVAQPADSEVMSSIKQAYEMGLARFILVGDPEKIRKTAEGIGLSLVDFVIEEALTEQEIAEAAVRAVHEGRADAVMKGLIKSSIFLKAVLNREFGLRKSGSIISAIAVVESDYYHKLLFLSDIAFSPIPDLETKKAILRNVVETAHSFGIDTPKVACISASEDVNPKIPASAEARMLREANERGEITGCIVEGPISVDLSVSAESAKHKGFVSPVAGDADILLMPDITTGNGIYKTMSCLSRIRTGGVMAGASAPIIFCSRSDTAETKRNTIAFAVYLSQNKKA